MVFVGGRISNYELDGNNDWYMPFKDELNLVYLNLHAIFGGGGTKWSSSEVDINSVWVQDFITREQYIKPKENEDLHLRLVFQNFNTYY